MSQATDYYKTLGVPKNATDDQIKQAYRKLAREHHPDVAKDKASAEKKFKEINEAYQVLGDASKRKMYDTYGTTGGQGMGGMGDFGGFGGGHNAGGSWGPFSYTYSTNGGSGGANLFGDIDPFDVFEQFFGFRDFGGGRAPKRVKSLHYQMSVSFIEAVKGTEKTIDIESGKVTIKIPAGIYNGAQIKYSGQGMKGPEGTPTGDLFITYNIKYPNVFEVLSADTLGVHISVDMVSAALGDVVDVPVVDANAKDGVGSAKLKIPSGIQPNTQMKLQGKGMPRMGGGHGDIIVGISIKVPTKLSRKQKELLEDFKRA